MTRVCDEMQIYNTATGFVREDGPPITEYPPEGRTLKHIATASPVPLDEHRCARSRRRHRGKADRGMRT